MPWLLRLKNSARGILLRAASSLVLISAFAFAFILEDTRALQVSTAVFGALALLTLHGAESRGARFAPFSSWCRVARPAVLLITVFVLGTTAAAVTTFLRVPPSVIGVAAFIPLLILFFSDGHSGRTFSLAQVASPLVATIVVVEFLIALLTLPLTFSVVGALVAVASAVLRESGDRIARGIFTLRFGLTMLGIIGGSLVMLLGSSRWS